MAEGRLPGVFGKGQQGIMRDLDDLMVYPICHVCEARALGSFLICATSMAATTQTCLCACPAAKSKSNATCCTLPAHLLCWRRLRVGLCRRICAHEDGCALQQAEVIVALRGAQVDQPLDACIELRTICACIHTAALMKMRG